MTTLVRSGCGLVPADKTSGFTLIELILVLAVLGVLATIATPIAQVTVQRSKENELRLALREIRSALDAHKRAFDDGRIVRTVDATGFPATLEVLVAGVENARDPKKSRMYFLRRIPRDPMADDSDGPAENTWGIRSYDSEPTDPKEGKDVFDVYSRSTRFGLNGVAYKKW